MIASGRIQKLKTDLSSPVEYELPIGDHLLPLNKFIGHPIRLKFEGEIVCIACNRQIRKSYSQGYCFNCAQRLARTDICMVRPEKCHFHLGTCREPEWGQTHCFIPHIVYIANTSGLKVGITRHTQIPTRWIDQGAIQALPILKTQNRYQSGLLEHFLKDWIQDKTDWRKMLKGPGVSLDLAAKKEELLQALKGSLFDLDILDAEITHLEYPVSSYPDVVRSLNFEKTPEITGLLKGIKGQYLILEGGVLNIRNLAGYVLSVEC